MKVSVRGSILDLLAFQGLPKARRKRIAQAPATPQPVHPVNLLVQQLHPERLHMIVSAVNDETASTRTFRLMPDRSRGTQALPYFRAGQYLSIKADVAGARITRPYSISSAPFESLGKDGFYEISVRRVRDGFFTPFMLQDWRVGTRVQASGPLGWFYHEPLRDEHRIVGLAGGSGVTPFRSMAREIVHGGLDAELLLLYGSSDEDDIVFRDEFQRLEQQANGKLRVVHVLSCTGPLLPGCEQGFITAEIMRKYADVGQSSFFVCGPQAMYEFVAGELAKLNLPRRRVRREAFGEIKDIGRHPDFPAAALGQTFLLKVRVDGKQAQVPASGNETVLVAMERAGLAPPSACRSGECGFCRSQLVSGDVFVVPDGDGRRAADRDLGFIHPCSTYPLSDLELRVPAES
jgi:ferredoxin-NADP reductase